MIKPSTEEEIRFNEYMEHMRKLGYEMMKNNRDFPVRVKDTKNSEVLKYINCKKQEEINNLINTLNEHEEYIDKCRVIVFGSVTNGLCQPESDVDFCLDVEDRVTERYVRNIIYKVMVSDVDVLVLNRISAQEKILKTIEKEGVEIWKKQC